MSLAGWYLSDDVHDPGRWAIPAATIAPHGYMTFDADTSFGAGDGFGLSQDGEDVVLSYLPAAAAGRIVDCLSFKGQEQGVSLGRYPDGGPHWFRLEPTHNAANKNPSLDVVIDEILYHPVDPNEEYIELYNPTAKPVDLHSATAAWRLSSGVDCNFPGGVSIPAGGRLVVVGFDPVVETSRYSAFLAAYHATTLIPGMTLVGPWTGSLSNSRREWPWRSRSPARIRPVPLPGWSWTR